MYEAGSGTSSTVQKSSAKGKGTSNDLADGATSKASMRRDLRGMSFADGEKALAPVQMSEAPGAAPAAAPAATDDQPLGVDSDIYADEIAAWERDAVMQGGPSGEALIAAGTGGPGVALKQANAQPEVEKMLPQLEAERQKVAQELADIQATRPGLEGDVLGADMKAAEAQKAASAKTSDGPAWATDEAVAVEALKDKKKALEKKEKAAEKKLKELSDDIDALSSAGTDAATKNKILAKRGSTASTAPEVDTHETDGAGNVGPREAGKGMPTASTLTETTTNMVDGAAVTKTQSGGYKVGGKGLEWSEGDETEIVAGDNYSKKGTNTTSWAMPLGGGRSTTKSSESSDGTTETKESSNETTSFTPWDGYNKSKSKESEVTKDGYTAKSAESSSTNVGLGGLTHKNSSSEQVDDHLIKKDSESKITRGDGKIGASHESTSVNGQVDAKGELEKGTATKKSAGADVTLTKDKAAVGAKADGERKTAHGNGTTTKLTGHCDGHVAVSVDPDPDKPGMFVLTVAMHASAGVGAGAGKEGGGKNKASASADVKASGSIDRVWVHHLSAEECEAYRNQLNGMGPGGGGTYPELAVIGQAWKSGWNDGAADAIKAMEADPDYIKSMQDGDSVETKIHGEASADGSIGGSTGAFGAKISGGVSTETDISNKFTANGDKTDMEAEVDTKTGHTVGGELTFEGVGLGADFGSKDVSGHGITLSVPKSDPKYGEIMDRVKRCTSEAEILALQKDYPQLKAQTTELTGKEKSEKVTVGFSKAKLTMGDEHGHTKKETKDADGTVVNTHYEGHETSSEQLSWDDKYTIGSSDKSSLDIDVDKDGNMSGDLSHTHKESDLLGTLVSATDKPQGSVISQATGANKTEVEETEISDGMFLKTSDFQRIMGEASDPKAWRKHGVQDQDGWKELGARIRAAGGDKQKVAAALTEFMDSNKGAHREMLEIVIRPQGAIDGGDAYQFPSDIAHLKGTYRALIDADPTKEIEELAKTDKAASVEKAKALYEQVESLEMSINSSHVTGHFTDEGRFGEMMHRIDTRKAQLTKLMGLGERGRDITRYNALITTCAGHKDAEEAAYRKILANYDGERETDPYANVATQNQLRQLYPRYQQDYAELSMLGTKWNEPRHLWSQYAPTPERLKKYEKGKPPEEATTEEENHEEAKQAEANRQSDQAWSNNPYHLQAQAQARQQEVQSEKAKAVAAERPRVNGAKSAAQNAAGWLNYANSQGKSVSPEAKALGGQGFTKMAELNDSNDNFEFVCGSPDADAKAVHLQAEKRIARWMEIKDLFDRGKAANHG